MTLDIPNYRILEKLGVGAQSRIFRARCMRTGKDYAVKIVKVQKPEDMTIVDMMRAEHAIGTMIDHPNVRTVYELRMIRHRLRTRGAILFMEYVDGVPISDSQFSESLELTLRLFRQVASALQAMHLAGYVHADLKPTNIVVDAEGSPMRDDAGRLVFRLGDLILAGAQTFMDGVAQLFHDQFDHAHRIVVAWYGNVHQVRVAIGVQQADDWNVKLVGLADGDNLAVLVDHHKRPGQFGHIANAAQVPLNLPHLAP